MANISLHIRLKEAREALGLTLTEAASKLGFPSYQTLMKIESGDREVKANELSRFAKAYFISLNNLLGEEGIKAGYNFLWRDVPEEKEKKEREAEFYYWCEQYNWVENLLNIKPKKVFLEVSLDDIRTNHSLNVLASRTRDLLGLGNRPAFSLQKVLEQDYGVKILFFSIPNGSALSMVHPQIGPVIIINSDEAPWRRNYDLAHELFHLLTWNAISSSDLKDKLFFDEIEGKANKFASILLLPENEVRNEIEERLEAQPEFTYSDLVDIAMEFGVSYQALLYRMAHLKFIAREEADKAVKDAELARIHSIKRKNEWTDKPESERFYYLAVRCLRKGLISRGKFAEWAGINRREIDDFISDKGLLNIEGHRLEIMAS